jgi:hypothetical protein
VITIADANRVLRDRLYAEKVAERLLDYLMRIDEVRPPRVVRRDPANGRHDSESGK